MRLYHWMMQLLFPPRCIFCGRLLKKEETEGTKKMQEDYNAEKKDDEVVFVNPNEEDWQNNTPGDELKKIEEERQKEKEEESRAREEDGEWDPLDEHWYGEKNMGKQ